MYPAIRSYETEKNLVKFADRMRGFLGLPRRRAKSRNYYEFYWNVAGNE